MAFDFHSDRDKYFRLQAANCRESIVPFIERYKKITPDLRVLEIGCRDGGVLLPFYENGNKVVGFDLEAGPVESAKIRYKEAIEEGKAIFEIINVHDYIPQHIAEGRENFDIIILKDVIEHVEGQKEMLRSLKQILNDNGIIYFGFPAWQSPFGGHQQVLPHKILSKLPYIHLLPKFIYFGLVKFFHKSWLNFVKEIRSTGISIEQFEHMIKSEQFQIISRDLYFVSPMYKHKFGLKSRLMWKWLAKTPYFRDFFATTCEYIVEKTQNLPE